MKSLKLSLLLLLLALGSYAQKYMSVNDAVVGRGTYLRPSSFNMPHWLNDDFLVTINKEGIYKINIQSGDSVLILGQESFNNVIKKDYNAELRNFRIAKAKPNELILKSAKLYVSLNLESNQLENITSIEQACSNVDYHYASSAIAYTKGQNLYIKEGNTEKKITNETIGGIVCGQVVHRNEFGISKGTFWSPTGKYLAFYRKDETMVYDYPLVDYLTDQAELKSIKYPMAGKESHQVTVGIYNRETGKTIYLQTGEPADHYLTNISWSVNEEHIYLAELNRGQNHMHLNEYNVNTGSKTRCIFEETSNTYVEPLHPILFSQKNNNEFYYWSRKDGYFHIYKYNTDGKLLKQITKGDWEVTEIYGFDKKENYLYIQATKESPIDRNIYRVSIKSGKIEKIDHSEGVHKATFSPSFANFIDSWSNSTTPGVIDIKRNDGKLIRTLETAPNTLADYDLGELRLTTIKAADGKTDLYTRMVLPNNFDPKKKYPAVIYVYGGPHAQLITNTWLYGSDWWYFHMASKGYIVLTVDSRGSANRGSDFETAIHKQLGMEETKDQMQGVKYLESLGFVDMDRIGVHGWSYGGFMTTNLMLHHPKTFKVGVAGGPVVDWHMYEVMYGERYMGHPEENPKGYEQSNTLNHAHKLEGKLMYIHGVQDDVVVMQHSMKFIRRCIELGKPIDFFAYPKHPHNVRGKDRVHLMEKVTQYFTDYL